MRRARSFFSRLPVRASVGRQEEAITRTSRRDSEILAEEKKNDRPDHFTHALSAPHRTCLI